MSEKPVVNAQECDPSTLGLARKPRPALKRKPATEVVVQLGPFTDGQITSPELVRPLEGPTEWLIKPRTGEIVPFDAGVPPEKDVVRKYITVGAQDNDVPEDLPKISDGYVVERVNQDVLPSMDSVTNTNGNTIVRVVENGGPASVECENTTTPPVIIPPVDPNEDPGENPDEEECPKCPPHCPPVDEHEDCDPPVDEEEDCDTPYCPPVDEHEDCDPPVDEEEDCDTPYCPPVDEHEDCDPPVDEEEDCDTPYCPPVDEHEDCDPPVDEEEDCDTPYCPPANESDCCDTPVDAVDDCASTKAGKSVLIDVLGNDKGCGDLTITEACAENGTVDIRDGKLYYTPNEGFCGEDVISYSMGDESCVSDSACVFMTVQPNECSSHDDDCKPAGESNCDYHSNDCDSGGGKTVHDHEYSSESYSETLFAEQMDRIGEILSDKLSSIDQLIQSRTSWSERVESSHAMECPSCAPVEEPVAAC